MSNFHFQRFLDASGWTQARLADLVNIRVGTETGSPGTYTDESIRKLLRGDHTWPRKPYRDALCKLFDSTPTELGFYNSRARGREPASDVTPGVGRQDFLRGMAALPVAAAVPDIDAGFVIESPAADAPLRVGMDHVRQVEAWAALFRQADDAGLEMVAGMTAQLRIATNYLGAQMSPHVAVAMKTAVATFYRVVGWAYYDRGDHNRACGVFDRALDLIADENEWWLRAATLTCKARQSIYRGQVDEALESLGIASIREDKLSMLRRADIAAVKARAFGRQGNHRECIRAVTHAEECFAESRDEDHPDLHHEGFREYYSETLLATDMAHGIFELAFTRGVEVPATIARLQRARMLSDQHARSRLLSSARLAALHLHRGDVEEGTALATAVVDRAVGTNSRRVVADIVRIQQLTAQTRIKKITAVSELHSRCRELLRSV